MKKTLYTKLAVGVLSLQVMAGSVSAQTVNSSVVLHRLSEEKAVELIFCGQFPSYCEDGRPYYDEETDEDAINFVDAFNPADPETAQAIAETAADIFERNVELMFNPEEAGPLYVAVAGDMFCVNGQEVVFQEETILDAREDAFYPYDCACHNNDECAERQFIAYEFARDNY